MIEAYYKSILLLPVKDFWKSKGYNYNSHKGIDFGYVEDENENCNVYPVQAGKVVDVFYSGSCGNAIALQHDYDDGTKRYSAYIHLKALPSLKIGTKVNSLSDPNPTILGKRGNTGESHGTHLHLYVTEATTKPYNWNLISQSSKYSLCTFDPTPFLRRSKGVIYFGDEQDQYAIFEGYGAYPAPVERNKDVKQVEVLIDYLYMRAEPNGAKYSKYATKGVYNVLSEKVDGAYNWYLIDEIAGRRFYIASGGTRTRDLLPEQSPEEVLKRRVAELEAQIDEYKGELKDATTKLEIAHEANRDYEQRITDAVETLTK